MSYIVPYFVWGMIWAVIALIGCAIEYVVHPHT